MCIIIQNSDILLIFDGQGKIDRKRIYSSTIEMYLLLAGGSVDVVGNVVVVVEVVVAVVGCVVIAVGVRWVETRDGGVFAAWFNVGIC